MSDREVVEGGGGAGSRTAAIAGLVAARSVHDRLLDCLRRNLATEASAGLLASGGVGLDVAVVVGRG